LARCSRRRAWHQCLACHGGPDVEYANRPSNILDSLLAAVLEGEVEFVAHLVAHDPADANPARLRQGFKPRRDIDAIAENVPAVNDDVAEVDADAKLDPSPGGHRGVAHGHLALYVNRAAHRVDDAGELDEDPIAGGFDDAGRDAP
jgi:hypothetical protein